ncbi:ATP-binding protein [Streptomyces sp. SCSIO 75703]|uniref:ATP-binding protein n=1 Tax=unclassified Streptomyces TaxID=2593676 RepID=UPI0004C0BEF1|nr:MULTISPECIES: ATP-binding protein [unclassified Streptomyces]
MSDSDPTETAAHHPGAERRRRSRPRRPAEARRTVERVVTECCHARRTPCDAGALSDAVLVASELTTNAILHAGGVTDFRVEVVGPGVRLSVSDRSSALPVVVEGAGPRGRRRLGGRGWPIVCRLAREVRVADLPAGGKCITVVVPLS